MSEKKGITLTEETPMSVLTLKQLHYVEARLQGLTPTAALRVAGMDQTSSTKVENHPKVRKALQWAVQQGIRNADELEKNDVISGMMDAVNAAATSAELVMAWREIGKLIGAYEPEKKVVELHTYSEREIRQLSDRDLARIAGDSMREVIEGEWEETEVDRAAITRREA